MEDPFVSSLACGEKKCPNCLVCMFNVHIQKTSVGDSDPDPYVFGLVTSTDPAADTAQNPSIIKQK